MLTTHMNVNFNKMHRMHSIYIQYTLSKKQIIKRGAALVNTISSYAISQGQDKFRGHFCRLPSAVMIVMLNSLITQHKSTPYYSKQ